MASRNLIVCLAGLWLTAALSTGCDGVVAARAPSQGSATPSLSANFELPQPIRPSSALDTIKRTTKENLDLARSVVVAKCVETRVGYGPGGNIFTFFTFETQESVKGLGSLRFVVRLFGGTMGNTMVSLPIDREFDVGDKYLLMRGSDSSEGYSTLNPAAVFVIGKEPQSGREVVVPGVQELPLYEKATGRPLKGKAEWSYLDDVVFSMKKAIQ